MPYSYAIYSGNGSQTQFAVSFPYIRKEHIVAYVNYALTTAFTWVNDSTIQFTVAPGAGQRVEIRRYSPTNARLVDYTDGSTLVAADLDTDSTQHLYKEQELDDDIKQSVYVDPTTGLPTASGQRITNVLDPVAAQDVATKNYVDTTTVASAGDTMTGPLAMSTNKITGLGNPTAAQDAATKNYVDTTTVASAGDTMTGQLNMGANKVVNLAEPTANQDAATKNYVDTTTWNNTTETVDSTEPWVASDAVIGTTGATTNEMDLRHDTLVQVSTPAGSSWRTGKTWLQNDPNKTLSVWSGSNWIGVASGGTFTLQPTVIYVDSVNGNDANDGHRIINPKKTIKNAVASAVAGDIIKVAPGVYQEVLPIDITVDNLSIVGDSQRSCFVHPTVATQEQIMFRCNSGTYIDGFTFAGLKASGARGGHPIDSNATYGLPTSQGWVAGFYPGCVIKKSPYVNNCTNFADASIDNSNFNPNNYTGTGGDLTSAPTGGGIIVDGSVPSVSSPLRSFVVNEFTQVCLDGPGMLVCNNGYAQAVSFFALFCHYHAKALSGGQINMEVGTTDFGRYGLIADGKSSSAIFTATANGGASAGAITFAINAPTAGGSWFGDANRPAINMLVQIGSDIYPILSSSANGSGWNVTISRPNPSNRAQNLGLANSHVNGAAVSFFLRSMISTASHTMEYAGSGTDYTALPENGGVPQESNESINLNNGKVWLTSTDQNGKFKVGDTFAVDQQTGFVTIDPNSYSTNLVSDLSPELGGNLDVLARNIYSSTGNVYINDTLEVNGGSAATPAITFTGDLNTGIYSPGADQFGISTGGTSRLTIDASGNINMDSGTVYVDAANNRLGIGTASPGSALEVNATAPVVTINSAAANASSIEFKQAGTLYGRVRFDGNNFDIGNLYSGGATIINAGNAERARIDSSGRLLVGTSSSPSAGSGQYSRFVVQGNTVASSAYLALQRNEAATSITAGEDLGIINFNDSSGNTFAEISAYADANAGSGDYPGRLVFSTTADGASSPTERMRITSDAYVRLASGTGGIQFNGDTAAANALDDYEEGTHAVTLTPSSSGSFTLNASWDTLGYCKIGALVTVQGSIIVSSSSSPLGYVRVSLPFAIGSLLDGAGQITGSVVVDASTGANCNQYVIIGLEGNSEARIYLGDGTGLQSDSAQGIGSSGQIYLSITYRTA